MNPIVFVVGCARSGTTLLKRIVDAHPQVAITPELHWLPRFYEKRKGLTPDGMVTPRLVTRLIEYPKFGRLQIGWEAFEELICSDEPLSYARFVTGLFDRYGDARGKRLVGNKTPSFVRRIPLLHGLWPEAKYVHLIRDGRDVCLSAIHWEKADKLVSRFSTWSEDPVATAAVWWQWLVQQGREAGTSLGPELYYEIRYEALVAHPAEECAKLCAFLGVPYDEAMVRFHEGRAQTDPSLSAKKAWRPITPGLRDWRSQMPAEEVERFEAAAGDLLDELGYPRAVPRPLPEAQQYASKIQDVFTQDARSIGWLAPSTGQA